MVIVIAFYCNDLSSNLIFKKVNLINSKHLFVLQNRIKLLIQTQLKNVTGNVSYDDGGLTNSLSSLSIGWGSGRGRGRARAVAEGRDVTL